MNEEQHTQAMAKARIAGRMMGIVAAGFGIVGVGLAINGAMTPLGFLVRVGLVIPLVAGYWWASSRLMRYIQRSPVERMPVIHAVLGPMGISVLFACGAIMFYGHPVARIIAGAFWIAPFSCGVGLALGGAVRRAGESTHCPKCEYEYRFENPADAPIRCPECGTPWLGRLRKGRKLKSGRLIASGLAIAVAAILVFQPLFFMGSLARHLPTSLLFASLYVTPHSTYGAWDELASRPLNAASIRILGARVLGMHATERYDTSSARWFEKMAAAGKMPAELVERYYAEGFAAQIQAPARAKAGQEFRVALRVNHAALGSGTQLALMFGGYRVGEEGEVVGRQEKSMWTHELHPDLFSMYRDVLPQTLRAGHPGDVRIHATYWINYQPSFNDHLKWKDNGTPETPSVSLWFRRFDIEKVVHVE